MDGPELSKHERDVLDVIERELRADVLLDRRLRTLSRGGIRPWSLDRRPVFFTCLLGITCATFFVRAVATRSTALLWTFAGLWVLTAVCVLQLAYQWAIRKTTARAHRRKG
ncbi:DUF3040 domain-containing protein [Streptomyces sp. NPDC054956]